MSQTGSGCAVIWGIHASLLGRMQRAELWNCQMKGLIPQWLIRRHGVRRIPPEVEVFSGICNAVGCLRRGRNVECNPKITAPSVTHNKFSIECYGRLMKYEALLRDEEWGQIGIKKENIGLAHSPLTTIFQHPSYLSSCSQSHRQNPK